jgi:hypothetical protein
VNRRPSVMTASLLQSLFFGLRHFPAFWRNNLDASFLDLDTCLLALCSSWGVTCLLAKKEAAGEGGLW